MEKSDAKSGKPSKKPPVPSSSRYQSVLCRRCALACGVSGKPWRQDWCEMCGGVCDAVLYEFEVQFGVA
jgi:transposase